MGNKSTKQGEPSRQTSSRSKLQNEGDNTHKPLPAKAIYNADEVAKKLKSTLEECNNNADVALLKQVKETSEHLEAIAKASNDFVKDAAEMTRWAMEEEDKTLISKAIQMASKQRDLSFRTMKVCSKIKTESDTWKQFYIAMVMAVKKLKIGNDQESRKILRERAVSNFPQVEEIVKALEKIHPEWEKHADDLDKLTPKFLKLSEKYDKKHKSKRREAMWKWVKLAGYVVGATILLAGVATLCVVAAPIAGGAGALAFGVTVSSGTAAGAASAAVSGAAACGVGATAASKAAYDAGKAASALESGGAHGSEMAKTCRRVARKLGNASENVKNNIQMFCYKLKTIIRELDPSKLNLQGKEGMSTPTADELCDALKFILESEDIDVSDEDIEANLKESVRACKELGVTILALESSLLALNSDPSQSAHIRKLYEEGVQQTKV